MLGIPIRSIKPLQMTKRRSPKVQVVYLACIKISEIDLFSPERILWLVRICFKDGHNFQQWRYFQISAYLPAVALMKLYFKKMKFLYIC